MLLPSHRFLPGDLDVWDRLHLADVIQAGRKQLERKAEAARVAIRDFAERHRCYAGVSWGKDSTVLAHLLASSGATAPLVWVRKPPTDNPDCERVRDIFLERYGGMVDYHEISVPCTLVEDDWFWDSPLAKGFAQAAQRFGGRHISAIRAQESGGRKIRMKRFGIESDNALAPIGWWKADDVFAYLERFGLPIHPAYAMSLGGTFERDRLRVDSLTGHIGEGTGRHDWERTYYGDELKQLGRWVNRPAGWQQ
jgi:phosphoadenosine phosphosulfate reductase